MASALLPSRSVFLALFASSQAAAQASPFLPLDDVRRPLYEHLVARGDLPDPTPLDRPWRVRELSVLLAGTDHRLTAGLAGSFRSPARRIARLTVHAGGQAFTQGRRDLLQRGGSGGVRGYAETGGVLATGPWIAAVRGIWENRLKSDPDWRGSQELADDRLVVRFADAYAGIQLPWATLLVGQRDRNWGPSNVPGIAVSDAGYPRPDVELQLGGRTLRFTGIATRMKGTAGSDGGRIERYFVAHRLSIQPTSTLTLAAWEAAVIAGPAVQLQASTRAVAPLLVIPAAFASRSHRNEMLGGQISWRPRPRLRLSAEVAIDDWNFDKTNPYPQRWAATLTGAGALRERASWQVTYTTASSLAFRTLNAEENFTDRGVGIGRLFPDNEEISIRVGFPARDGWLLTPRLALLRQGEGRIQDRFPSPSEASGIPARFIGTVASTFWAGTALAGWHGPLAVAGEAGVRHTVNANHLTGSNRTTVEVRITAMLGILLERSTP
jgi:hypothetical protein